MISLKPLLTITKHYLTMAYRGGSTTRQNHHSGYSCSDDHRGSPCCPYGCHRFHILGPCWSMLIPSPWSSSMGPGRSAENCLERCPTTVGPWRLPMARSPKESPARILSISPSAERHSGGGERHHWISLVVNAGCLSWWYYAIVHSERTMSQPGSWPILAVVLARTCCH